MLSCESTCFLLKSTLATLSYMPVLLLSIALVSMINSAWSLWYAFSNRSIGLGNWVWNFLIDMQDFLHLFSLLILLVHGLNSRKNHAATFENFLDKLKLWHLEGWTFWLLSSTVTDYLRWHKIEADDWSMISPYVQVRLRFFIYANALKQVGLFFILPLRPFSTLQPLTSYLD